MFREEKNLKDSKTPSPLQGEGWGEVNGGGLSYTKTNKLITALYMVTDIIDKDEPLRNKLRTLGTGIVSDINSIPSSACSKISELMSFLDIASAINIISEMNCNILRKEFAELDQAIKELRNKKMNLSDFLNSPLEEYPAFKAGGGGRNLSTPAFSHSSRGELIPKGHTSIGVQKGSTLLKALSGIEMSNTKLSHKKTDDFDILKKQRRDEIVNLIQKKGGGTTITDIKNGAYGSLISCSEKTLQRELISMVKNGVLNKVGEKRWSRYFLNTTPP